MTPTAEQLLPSGLPWLPAVPEHWDIARLKYVARLGTGHTPSRQVPEYWENCTIPWLTLGDVWQLRDGRKQIVDETAEKISELGLAKSAAVLHPAGTVFLSRTASVGFSGIMGVDMATSQDFVTWTCGERLRPRFLLYVLRAMKQEFKRLVMGSTHKTIYMPDVERISVPLPPLAEQDAVIGALDNEMREMDELGDLLQRQSALLDERRSVLILNTIGGGPTQQAR